MDSISEQLPSVFKVVAYFIEGNLALRHNGKTVFYYQDDTYTYAQVSSFVRRTAQLLSHLGIERETRRAILLPQGYFILKSSFSVSKPKEHSL